jgi:hypothetical protein
VYGFDALGECFRMHTGPTLANTFYWIRHSLLVICCL